MYRSNLTKGKTASFDDEYVFTVPHGELVVSHNMPLNWVNIATIDVDRNHRRKGIAKLLLRDSLLLIDELNPDSVFSALVSRESIEAFEAVFGDFVQVTNRGLYAPNPGDSKGGASGVLWWDRAHGTKSIEM